MKRQRQHKDHRGPSTKVAKTKHIKSYDFNDKSKADIEFVCGKEIIKAHRPVIERIPYFKRLLSEPNAPALSSITVTDDVEVFKTMLCYVYGMRVVVDIDRAFSLLDVAEQYEEKNLAEECKRLMVELITCDSALFVWSLLDEENHCLVAKAEKFIKGRERMIALEHGDTDQIVRFLCKFMWNDAQGALVVINDLDDATHNKAQMIREYVPYTRRDCSTAFDVESAKSKQCTKYTKTDFVLCGHRWNFMFVLNKEENCSVLLNLKTRIPSSTQVLVTVQISCGGYTAEKTVAVKDNTRYYGKTLDLTGTDLFAPKNEYTNGSELTINMYIKKMAFSKQ